jgi:hypothetical protein
MLQAVLYSSARLLNRGTLEPHCAADLVLAIERRPVPFCEISRGGIGFLQKFKDSMGGIFGSSRIGVVQNELDHLRVKSALPLSTIF